MKRIEAKTQRKRGHAPTGWPAGKPNKKAYSVSEEGKDKVAALWVDLKTVKVMRKAFIG